MKSVEPNVPPGCSRALGLLGTLEQVFLSIRAAMEVVANPSRTNPAFISTYFSGETITHSANTELPPLG